MAKHDDSSSQVGLTSPEPATGSSRGDDGPPESSSPPLAPLAASTPVPPGKRPRRAIRNVPRAPDGTPLGRGGHPCSTCGTDHQAGERCNPAGLKARGWQKNGTRSDGRQVWLAPGSAKRRSALNRGLDAPADLLSAAKSVVMSKGPLREELLRLGRSGDSPAAFAARCEPATFRLWLWTARARIGGADAAGIAASLGVSPAIVNALLSSPVYQCFEAEARLAGGAGDLVERVRQRIMDGCEKALDALEHWRDQRDPELANVSRLAAKDWLAAAGIVTDKSVRTVRRVDIPASVVERLAEGAGMKGA